MSNLNRAIVAYATDSENAERNYELAFLYDGMGQTAAAISYYLRAAERTKDKELSYECLLKMASCFDRQGDRIQTVRGIYKQAILFLPKRPEAYYLLSRHLERCNDHMDSYTYADTALTFCVLEGLKPLRGSVDYPGTWGLIFEKAVCAWWWGKANDSRKLFKLLLEEYYNDMDVSHQNATVNNMIRLGVAVDNRLNDIAGFDWGGQDAGFADMLRNELFVDRIYEKHFNINSGDIVFDAGSNVGGFAYSILHKSPKQIYCVEPSPKMLQTLMKNLAGKPVTIIPKAIDYVESTGRTIPSSGVYIYGHDGNYDTTTFKKIIEDNNIERIDFLKFDCEGGEYSIFTEENYEFIRNKVKYMAGEWHINDHENAIERFIKFRDLYLTHHDNFRIYERGGTERTSDIFDDKFLYSFADWWKPTQYGQFMIYINNESNFNP